MATLVLLISFLFGFGCFLILMTLGIGHWIETRMKKKEHND